MSKSEREAFLADLHVGVLSVADGARGPLSVPVWYIYEPGGDVWFSTGRESEKARLLRGVSRASLVAQTETAPYQYVMVEGLVSFGPADYEQHLRPMAHRYLGEKGGEAYLRSTGSEAGVAGSLIVRITPDRWRTVDYGKR
ncbi:MAG: pyridoxamine 5'-phosphate oxidase family protein [Dehalococcoidia bacterium]|nr:pyridoxamine 5'-phosphate oxidase family protein [Dehalococcoidia bacterium]MCB9486648.1 pyridoxamine 5'-phosphate oxidase family protein [Thermoflexaceae bacterium]